MNCVGVRVSGHALRRMFERAIGQPAVLDVLAQGMVIARYPNDRPYPSELLLGFFDGRPLHVVVAREPDRGCCVVVTAYEPDSSIWSDDFKSRRTP